MKDDISSMFLTAVETPENTVKNDSFELGKVQSILPEGIFITASDGNEIFIPQKEIGNLTPSLGDELPFIRNGIEKGVLQGSVAKALEIQKRIKIHECKVGDQVKGKIVRHIVRNGEPKGFDVALDLGIDAFLPMSHAFLDSTPEEAIGREVVFEILEIKRNNVVVSHKNYYFHTELPAYQETFFENHKEGDILEGKVIFIKNDHVLLNVENIKVFLHISSFSWKFLKSFEGNIALGDTLKVKILFMNPEKHFVKVGRKQLEEDPWETVPEKYSVGTKAHVKIIRLKKEGIIAELEPGVELFVHQNNLTWLRKKYKFFMMYHIGDELDVLITNLDKEKRELEGSVIALQENPWEKIQNNAKVGDTVLGTVISVTDFGVFFSIDDQVEGILHKEDAFWDNKDVDLKKKFKPGEQIELRYLYINATTEKIHLGLKQLHPTSYHLFVKENPKNSEVSGTILEILDDSIKLQLANNVVATVKDFDKSASYQIGDTMTGVLSYVIPDKEILEVSIIQYNRRLEEKDVNEYLNQNVSSDASSLKNALGNFLKNNS